METEWQKYVEFNAAAKEMNALTREEHVCIPTKWVLTDKNQHSVGTPGYTHKWRARLVARGNLEQMNGKDIRTDSPTAEQLQPTRLPTGPRSLGGGMQTCGRVNYLFLVLNLGNRTTLLACPHIDARVATSFAEFLAPSSARGLESRPMPQTMLLAARAQAVAYCSRGVPV